jgi:hypothetical protein
MRRNSSSLVSLIFLASVAPAVAQPPSIQTAERGWDVPRQPDHRCPDAARIGLDEEAGGPYVPLLPPGRRVHFLFTPRQPLPPGEYAFSLSGLIIPGVGCSSYLYEHAFRIVDDKPMTHNLTYEHFLPQP